MQFENFIRSSEIFTEGIFWGLFRDLLGSSCWEEGERGRDKNYLTLISRDFVALFFSMREKSGDDDELRIDFVYWSGFFVVQWEYYDETG